MVDKTLAGASAGTRAKRIGRLKRRFLGGRVSVAVTLRRAACGRVAKGSISERLLNLPEALSTPDRIAQLERAIDEAVTAAPERQRAVIEALQALR